MLRRLPMLGPWLLLACAAAAFAGRAWDGLWFLQFADETMALLGGRVLDAGGLLYRDFVDNHGPVLFLLTASYGALAGWEAPNAARLIPVLLLLLATLAVALSQALPTRAARVWGAALFLGLTAAVWLFQGLYLVNYYTVGGALAVIALALFVAPVWLGATLGPGRTLAAGGATALLAFTCYCFMPSAGLFAVAALVAWRRGEARAAAWFAAGGLGGLVAVLLWLAVHGDVRGYLAFHIAFGQTAYRPFVDVGADVFLRSLLPSLAPAARVQTLAVLATALAAVPALGLAARGGRARAAAAVAGVAGVLLLNARGASIFQDGSFVIAAFGLLALMLPAALARAGWTLRPAGRTGATLLLAGLLGGVELAARGAIATPTGLDRAGMRALPPSAIARRDAGPFGARIRALVRPDEQFLALVFRPDLYFAADRLPMSGYYEYLPWDAAYARAPWFGRPRDLCLALQAAPPPLIFFDNWTVWDRYDPADYMPCVPRILAERYRRLADFPDLYLRSDRPAE